MANCDKSSKMIPYASQQFLFTALLIVQLSGTPVIGFSQICLKFREPSLNYRRISYKIIS